MDINYIRLQAQRYNSGNCDQDRCLYEIAKQASLFTAINFTQMQGGKLTPQMRSLVLHWLRQNANKIGLTLEREV